MINESYIHSDSLENDWYAESKAFNGYLSSYYQPYEEIEAMEIESVDYYPLWDSVDYELDYGEYWSDLAEGLRESLHQDYQDAPPEYLQEALFDILDGMTPAEGLSFGGVLNKIRKFGKKTYFPQPGQQLDLYMVLQAQLWAVNLAVTWQII